MSMLSYSDVFGIEHKREHAEEFQVGDLIRTGPNYFPHYRILAINEDKAWVRNVDNGMDGVTRLIVCRKIDEQKQSDVG